jgi:2-C-methyl-D-erythritol 4-phosphate cytidylyltransferase
VEVSAIKVSAIIVAAGLGARLGCDTPKAFIHLAGRSLLAWSLRTIASSLLIDEAVITIPDGMQSRTRAEVVAAGLKIPVKLTPGGAERQESVRIALALTSAEASIVVVHDAARPFANPATFAATIAAAMRTGGAIAAIPLADTLKRVANDGRTIAATIARVGLWQAQTPQAFRRDLLIAAHERAMRDAIVATDDADLVERCGATVDLIEGSALNFKITTSADLTLAAALAASPDLR